jgi:hypothetical protein
MHRLHATRRQFGLVTDEHEGIGGSGPLLRVRMDKSGRNVAVLKADCILVDQDNQPITPPSSAASRLAKGVLGSMWAYWIACFRGL